MVMLSHYIKYPTHKHTKRCQKYPHMAELDVAKNNPFSIVPKTGLTIAHPKTATESRKWELP
jgi:hypothetical protein